GDAIAGRVTSRLSRFGGARALQQCMPTLRFLLQLFEMSASLQVGEQDEAWNRGRRADREIADPAGGLGEIAAACREYRASERRQCGQQRVLCRGVQWIAAERGKIGDQRHRAESGGELFGGDGKGQPPDIASDDGLPGKGE